MSYGELVDSLASGLIPLVEIAVSILLSLEVVLAGYRLVKRFFR